MPTVSICMPVYNGERHLAEAIESVLAQTYGDYELLITDDCSQDSSLEIALSYARRDSRISVQKNAQNLGLFSNYNACMAKAGGKFIKLYAQDDLFAPEMLARALDVFASEQDIALFSSSRLTINDEGQSGRAHEQLDSSRVVDGEQAIQGCLVNVHNWIGEPSAVMFPQSLIGEGFDTTYYHLGDLEYWLRILTRGKLAYLHEPLCKFRFHAASATNRNMKALIFSIDALRLGRKYKQLLAGLGIGEEDYARNVIGISSFFVHDMVRAQGVTAEESAAVQIGGADKDLMLTQFRELAFHALLFGHDAYLRAEAARSELEGERLAAEEKLRTISNSPILRAAKALKIV